MIELDMENEKRLIGSIKKASELLGLIAEEKRPLGITDLARLTRWPKATIATIVATLEAVGYLEKDAFSPKYRLGPRLFQLGLKCMAGLDLVTMARAWMERFSFQFMEPINLGMRVGDSVTIIMRIEPENRYMVFPQAGSTIPLHSTCIGKVLLAYMDRTERERLLEKYPFVALTPNTITSRAAFLKELARVKKTGVSFDRQESINGLAGIGGPIFNHAGAVVAGFAISGNAARIEEAAPEIIETVKFTTQQVSAQLGYLPGTEKVRRRR
jgi:IclR family KDG regulon transcriptional repressor